MKKSETQADSPLRVVQLRPSSDQVQKPQELIQITGHQELSLVARRSITLLWHNAHSQGISSGKDYTIELDHLIATKHKGYEVIEDAIESLMKTIIVIHKPDGSKSRVQFLGGNDMSSPTRSAGVLTYSLDKRLEEILKDSTIWGQISLPVLVALTNRYSVSLYERVAQWAGLTHKTSQEFTLEEFRVILGLPDKKYERFGELNKHVIKLAVAEINALAPFNVAVLPVKTGKKVTRIRLSWWVKSTEEAKEAWNELQRPRVGRKARIQGKAEMVFSPMPSEQRLAAKYRDSLTESPDVSLLDPEDR